MKEIDNIEVLNKSSEDKEEFYRKKINLLFGIVSKIGGNVDLEFRKSLEFPKFKTLEKADPKLIESQEARTVLYIRYLENIIQNNIEMVDPLDRVEIEVFERKNKNWEDYLQNIVSKSQEEEEDDSNIPIIKKNRLGQTYREE